ncbi:hypothetical protein [Paenibacillus abyssi]|uniref:Fungal lipase-like domain-containing protein n=1 Tax=Paenibacillus abyssi TaxID=1340531 RepID=A0A917CSG4_9BACL|nr:hypothetical protein [Paenibacillus abyssi]GGF95425.1 hypothetical protein GCM10010916_10960 [Paenibacillus abyssi]
MESQTAQTNETVSIYLLAGVATAPHFFHKCCETVEQLSRQSGWKSRVRVLFPYGDNSRSVYAQVGEVAGDLTQRFTGFCVGGRYVAQQIRDTYEGEPLILIGHSGGGAAAYQAIRILSKERKLGEYRIIQIGSPKVPIHPDYRRHVYYIHLVDVNGKFIDPITRLGSWGGWTASRFKLPSWNNRKYAPGHVEGLTLVGGHADYLRHDHPFVDTEQVSNMERTLGRAWQWLHDSMPRRTMAE